MIRRELEAVMEELLLALAPQMKGNPLASLMLGQLQSFLNGMPEEEAERVALQIVKVGHRLEEALRRKGVVV